MQGSENQRSLQIAIRQKKKIIKAYSIVQKLKNLKKYPKIDLKERQAKLQRGKLATKLYKITRNDCHVHIVKMKHIFYVAIHIALRSQTQGLLLYARGAASVILENCHLLLSKISKMSTKTLTFHHQQGSM